MDEETWLVNQQFEIFCFVGNSLDEAFAHLNQNNCYLVVQDFEPVGAACMHAGTVHFSNWRDVPADHEEMLPAAFRDKIVAMAQTPYQQRFAAPHGEGLPPGGVVIPLLQPAVFRDQDRQPANRPASREAALKKPALLP